METVTAEQAARIMGRSIWTIHRWRKAGRGPKPVQRIGTIYLYSRQACEAYAQALAAVEPPDIS